MLVKKFEAEDMASALKQVKDTLGSDALILSTRTLRKNGLGVLGKQTIEVTAAIESPAMKAPQKKFDAPGGQPFRTSMPQAIPAAYASAANRGQVVKPVAKSPAPKQSFSLQNEIENLQQRAGQSGGNDLQAQIEQLRGVLDQMASSQQHTQQPEQEQPQEEYEAAEYPSFRQQRPSETRDKGEERSESVLLVDMLLDRGIDRDAASTIARFADQQMNDRQRQDLGYCREYLSKTLSTLVYTSGPLWQPGQGQKRIALIGPTGVGKTTTIAKLAAAAVAKGARVALVTIDTYRIAAVEQLKVYGDIMGLPVEVVLAPEQLQTAINRHRDKDLILIDTAGRSPRDQEQISELNEFLGSESQVENCLVLAAPTDERLQQQILDGFSALPIARLIFTKLDETDRCGVLINLPTKSNLPLAYLTNGQQVPEDLILAEPQTVAELVMG